MNDVYGAGHVDIATGKEFRVNGTQYLGNCDNVSDTNKPVSTAQQTALDLKANITSGALTSATLTNTTFAGSVTGLAKGDVGLGSVDNTSDVNKPVSTAAQTALDDKLSLTSGGQVSGDITLKKSDGSGVALRLSRTDHNDMNHEFKLVPSYVNINQEGLSFQANGQPICWMDERIRFAIGNVRPDEVLDVTGNITCSGVYKIDDQIVRKKRKVQAADASTNITDPQNFSYYLTGSANQTVELPGSGNVAGDLITVHNFGTGAITFTGTMVDEDGSDTSSNAVGAKKNHQAIWNGSKWQLNN